MSLFDNYCTKNVRYNGTVLSKGSCSFITTIFNVKSNYLRYFYNAPVPLKCSFYACHFEPMLATRG